MYEQWPGSFRQCFIFFEQHIEYSRCHTQNSHSCFVASTTSLSIIIRAKISFFSSLIYAITNYPTLPLSYLYSDQILIRKNRNGDIYAIQYDLANVSIYELSFCPRVHFLHYNFFNFIPELLPKNI